MGQKNQNETEKKSKKNLIKWIFVVLIIGLIIFAFRDSAGPIFEELKQASIKIIILICIASLLYGVVESIITWIFGKVYKTDFKFTQALGMTYFVSFYRTATIGSGAGVAGIIYLSRCGLKNSEACGMYMIEYAFHKVSMAVLAAILLFANWSYFNEHYGQYTMLIFAGFGLTVIITACLMLFATAAWFHNILFVILDKLNFKGKFTDKINSVKEQAYIMEDTSKALLKKKGRLALVVLLNLIKFSCWYSIPYIILGSSNGLTFMTSLAITTLGVMLAAVIPTPAGIGSTEFVFGTMYSGIVGSAASVAASLLYRFATFVFPFLVGIFVAVFFRKLVKKQDTN